MKESKVREIKEGHGLTDVSCSHGSRWIWWESGADGKGRWECVVWASNCDCGEPPKPFKKKVKFYMFVFNLLLFGMEL